MTESSFVLGVATGPDVDENIPGWEIRPGTVSRGFHEGREYWIRKPIVDAQLLIDDLPLESRDGYWIWSPGFYAGQVCAELLVHGGQVVITYVLDVSPDPRKLGRDVFQAMLDEIWNFDPRLVLGTEPPQSPVGHETQVADPWLEYARLRSYGDSFVRALGVIARHPIRELRAERAFLPLQYVRRADRQTALAAVRIPAVSASTGRPRVFSSFHKNVAVVRCACDSRNIGCGRKPLHRPGHTGCRPPCAPIEANS